MSWVYFIFIFFSLMNSGWTNEVNGQPKMLENILIQSSNTKTEYPNHFCHNELDDSKDGSTNINTDYFHAKIECELQCENFPAQTITLAKDFIPHKLSLYAGDGSSNEKILWRSLGITLKIWSKQICYDHAKNFCENKIQAFKVNKIYSGNWSWNTQLDCQQKEIVYSPFDERFKLDQTGVTKFLAFPEQQSITNYLHSPSLQNPKISNSLSEFISNEDSKEKLLTSFNKKKCKTPIKVSTCFGDCVWEANSKDSLWSETLATTKYYGSDEFSICIDDIKHKLKSESKSKDVQKFKCEKYVWEFIRATEMTGSSCAALRYVTNCKNLKF